MGTVVGLVESRRVADLTVEALHHAGFRDQDISVVVRHPHTGDEVLAEASRLEAEAGTGDGTAVGAVGGGVAGTIAGLAMGLGALAIPGIGPVLAAGPIAAAIAGGAVGVATGGMIGSLIDQGVSEEDARHAHAGVERGGILIAVHTPVGREDAARAILKQGENAV